MLRNSGEDPLRSACNSSRPAKNPHPLNNCVSRGKKGLYKGVSESFPNKRCCLHDGIKDVIVRPGTFVDQLVMPSFLVNLGAEEEEKLESRLLPVVVRLVQKRK